MADPTFELLLTKLCVGAVSALCLYLVTTWLRPKEGSGSTALRSQCTLAQSVTNEVLLLYLGDLIRRLKLPMELLDLELADRTFLLHRKNARIILHWDLHARIHCRWLGKDWTLFLHSVEGILTPSEAGITFTPSRLSMNSEKQLRHLVEDIVQNITIPHGYINLSQVPQCR